MSYICPRTSKQCIDDVCIGMGVCAISKGMEDILSACQHCGQPERWCSCFDDPDERGPCNTCGGTGVYSTCIDDLCHGGECIHGDYSGCPDCDGDL